MSLKWIEQDKLGSDKSAGHWGRRARAAQLVCHFVGRKTPVDYQGDPFIFADFLDLRQRIQSALLDPFTDFRLFFGARTLDRPHR